MSELAPAFRQQFLDANGAILSGGQIFTYAAGTTTPLATYTDQSGNTPNANPVVLDSSGKASIWIGDNAYKFVVEDSLGNVIETVDNIVSIASQIEEIVANANPFLKVTMSYTQFQTAATSNAVAAFSIPAGNILKNVIFKHTTAFAGTSITAVSAQLGTSGTPDQIIPDFDVLQAVSDSAFDNVFSGFVGSFASPTPILVNLISTGANLSALTTGSLDIYYQYEKFLNT